MSTLVLVVIGILVLSGFFSGVEAALVSINDAEIGVLVSEHRFGAKILSRVNKHLNRSVITIVVFNNIVNIVGSIVVGQIVIDLYGDAVLAVITTALTFGIIVFSEIIPKSVGIHYSERIGCMTAPIILALTMVFLPLILILEGVTRVFQRGERKVGTEAQIRSLVTIGRRAGHIESDEGQLIHRAFILNDKRARDIMTPLKDIDAVQYDMTIGEAAEKVIPKAHSRYPVFGVSVNDVEGIVMKQDLLQALTEGKQDKPITELMRECIVTKSSLRSDELLSLFRDKSTHLAVVQEDDHTVGVVTLEDVLEELVGEIEDEMDVGE